MSITKRIDNITKVNEELLKRELPCPEAVKIEVASVCNQRCKFCNVGNGNSGKFMSLEQFKLIAGKCKEAGIKEIGLFYLGESTLHPDLSDMIKYCKDIGVEYVFLTTNGTAVSDWKIWLQYIEAGLDSLKFSVNFYDEDDYYKNTGIKDGWMRQYINIRCVYNFIANDRLSKSPKYKTKIYASYIERETQEEDEIMKNYIKNFIKPLVDECYELPLYNQACFKRTHKYVGNMGRLGNLVNPIPCWGVFRKPNITVDGHMTLCYFDFESEFICGDLKEQSFMECWNSKFAQELRQQHINNEIIHPRCKKCLDINNLNTE